MDEKDEIGKLLEEYQKQRTQHKTNEGIRKVEQLIDFAAPEPPKPLAKEEPKPAATPEPEPEPIDEPTGELEPIAPPMPLQTQEISPQELLPSQDEEKKPEKVKKEKPDYSKKFKEYVTGKSFKRALIAVVAVVAVICLAFGISSAVSNSKSSYLKSYESKYGFSFPDGMLKEYCDYYGENRNTSGFIKIGDLALETPVFAEGKKAFPYVKSCREDCDLANYIVYLDTNELEQYYNSAEAYNNAEQYISYSNLFSNFSYKVISAFYTNTKPEDDNGYVFPYATPETMTEDSASTFVTDLQTRFLYSTGDSFSRKDRLLIISCPTDFRKDFEFVLVCKLTDATDRSTAKDNDADRIHFPQAVFDDSGKDNPYKLAHGWYPEIVTIVEKNENGEDVTKPLQLTKEDYE